MGRPTELYRRALALRSVDPMEAEGALRAAAAAFGSAGDEVGRGECLLELAHLALSGASLEEAQRYAARALDCLAPAGDERAGRAALFAGEMALCCDDEAAAESWFEMARERSVGPDRVRAQELLGQLALDHGAHDEAEAHWLAAWRDLEDAGDALRLAEFRQHFAELALSRGRIGETIAQLEAALVVLDPLRDADAGMLRANIHTEIADLQADRGRVQEAILAYEAALDFYERADLPRQASRVARRRDALRWNAKAG
ncbi:MAG: hypothetical protein AAGH15_17730 [Myxococcota bacterium]